MTFRWILNGVILKNGNMIPKRSEIAIKVYRNIPSLAERDLKSGPILMLGIRSCILRNFLSRNALLDACLSLQLSITLQDTLRSVHVFIRG